MDKGDRGNFFPPVAEEVNRREKWKDLTYRVSDDEVQNEYFT